MAVSDLTELDLAAARDGLRAKEFSAVELTEAYLAEMSRADALNCFITQVPDRALEMARASDARLADGTAGITNSLFDNIAGMSSAFSFTPTGGINPPVSLRSNSVTPAGF